MILTLDCVQEAQPGLQWQALFQKAWPFYKPWFLSEGPMARRGYLSSYTQLDHYMPELIPLYNTLVALAGGGDTEARFLSMYCPPAYLAGCSQLAVQGSDNFLIRNYDYSPTLLEGNFLCTHWLKPVMGMSDCAWGLLDGINGDGLAISLAFGGRKVMGEGFGIPIILRYVLETCSNTAQAVQRLQHIPSHMAYNLTLIDAAGIAATVYLSPENPPLVKDTVYAANQQEVIDWPYYAKISGTEERHAALSHMAREPAEPREAIVHHFLQKPLYCQNYHQNFGTLYTVLYDTLQRTAHLYWPDDIQITQSLHQFYPHKQTLHLAALRRRTSLYK